MKGGDGTLNSIKRYSIFNTFVNAVSLKESLIIIEDIIKKGEPTQHVVINASKVNLMNKDPALTKIVNSCPLINADGASIVWASRKFGIPVKERVTGIDLFCELVKLASYRGYRIFLFGAKEEVVLKVRDILTEEYPTLRIVGYRNGYFEKNESKEIAQDIRKTKPDIVFVAFSSPMKEYWVHENLEDMNVPFVMGVGGSFDVIAGVTKRAPVWIQRFGLEWFYRFIQEPIRLFNRYIIGNIKFIILTYKTLYKKNRG